MTTRTITFDDEQWQVVPKDMAVEMLDMLQGYIDADGDAVSAWADTLGEAPEPETCFCDEQGIGDPKQSCGDCPQDYGIPTVRANPEPPAQQPTSRDREVWRAAITLANNICVQESDRYNDEDATREASATGHCAQRIRDWIAPTDEQLAEMLDEAGIGKGESNAD